MSPALDSDFAITYLSIGIEKIYLQMQTYSIFNNFNQAFVVGF